MALALLSGPLWAQVPAAPRELHPERWADDNLAIGYIGHASVLVKLTGTFILTDPAFFERIGVTVGPVTIGPQRLVRPALPLERVPLPAAIVISHAHFDSLDLPSLAALPKDTVLVAPRGCADLLADLGFRKYVELAWGERVDIDSLSIQAVPVRHWGGRYPLDRARGYNAYVLSKDGVRVLFAPDTAYTEDFRALAASDAAPHVAIIGTGAYDPWVRNHATPEQVWRMFLDSGARYLAPVHWDTFRLGKEPVGDALRRLTVTAGDQHDRIVLREIGGEWFWRHPR